jgi:polynucleotide 5'-kinase involved in rRNA processing
MAATELKVQFRRATRRALKDARLPWFTEPICERGPITVRWDDLKAVAEYIDEKMGGSEWCDRLAQIAYRHSEDYLQTDNPDSITVDGFTLLAGMVSSGKSTLMILLAAHLVYDTLSSAIE